MSSDMLGFEKVIDTTTKTTHFSHGTQQGTFKISSFESYIVLGFLGLILELSWVSLWISLGLSWSHLGLSWRLFGLPWALLGSSWAVLGLS